MYAKHMDLLVAMLVAGDQTLLMAVHPRTLIGVTLFKSVRHITKRHRKVFRNGRIRERSQVPVVVDIAQGAHIVMEPAAGRAQVDTVIVLLNALAAVQIGHMVSGIMIIVPLNERLG